MIRPLTLLAFVLSCFGCGSGHRGLVTSTYNTVDEQSGMKATYSAYHDKNGSQVKHGRYVLWYPSGSRFVEAQYVDGKLHGVCLVFDRQGKIALKGEYKNGVPWNGQFQVGHEIQSYLNGVRRKDDSLNDRLGPQTE